MEGKQLEIRKKEMEIIIDASLEKHSSEYFRAKVSQSNTCI